MINIKCFLKDKRAFCLFGYGRYGNADLGKELRKEIVETLELALCIFQIICVLKFS